MSEVKGDVLKLKKRGEDGNRVITVRIKEETLSEIDRIAKEVNYSRNELINTILEHGVRTIEIEQEKDLPDIRKVFYLSIFHFHYAA